MARMKVSEREDIFDASFKIREQVKDAFSPDNSLDLNDKLDSILTNLDRLHYSISPMAVLLGRDLRNNNKTERATHKGIRKSAITRYLKNNSKVRGDVSLSYRYRGLKTGYGVIEMNIMTPNIYSADGFFNICGEKDVLLNKNETLLDYVNHTGLLHYYISSFCNNRFISDLIEIGVDLERTDSTWFDRTPFQLALENNNPEVALLLLKAGANPHTIVQNPHNRSGTLYDALTHIRDENTRALIKMKIDIMG